MVCSVDEEETKMVQPRILGGTLARDQDSGGGIRLLVAVLYYLEAEPGWT